MPDFWLPLTAELPDLSGATARLKRPNGNFLDLDRKGCPSGREREIARSKIEGGSP